MRQRVQSRLGRAVKGQTFNVVLGGNGADVDDATAPGYVRQGGAHDVDGGEDVLGELRVDVLQGRVGRGPGQVAAGVVDDNVDVVDAKRREGLGHERLGALLGLDVLLDGHGGSGAVSSAEALGRGVGLGRRRVAHVVDGHRGAVARQRRDDGGADARVAARACHDGHLALQR